MIGATHESWHFRALRAVVEARVSKVCAELRVGGGGLQPAVGGLWVVGVLGGLQFVVGGLWVVGVVGGGVMGRGSVGRLYGGGRCPASESCGEGRPLPG